jgi:hypothetical protein
MHPMLAIAHRMSKPERILDAPNADRRPPDEQAGEDSGFAQRRMSPTGQAG